MQEWDLLDNRWPRKDISCEKVSNDTCLEITMSIADELDLPQVKALIEPVLRPRSVSTGIPNQPGLKVQAQSTKEDLYWVVSVDGQRLYESSHPGDPNAFDKGLRTLRGAIREAEIHLAAQLSGIWQEHLASQFAREALSDFDYQSFRELESG